MEWSHKMHEAGDHDVQVYAVWIAIRVHFLLWPRSWIVLFLTHQQPTTRESYIYRSQSLLVNFLPHTTTLNTLSYIRQLFKKSRTIIWHRCKIIKDIITWWTCSLVWNQPWTILHRPENSLFFVSSEVIVSNNVVSNDITRPTTM